MNEENILKAMEGARPMAWGALAYRRFPQFGHHAGQWFLLNRLLPKKKRQSNPFALLVQEAQAALQALDVADRITVKLRGITGLMPWL